MTIRTTPSQRLKILLFLGGLQILAYYFVGSMLTPRLVAAASPAARHFDLYFCQW